MLRVSPNLPCVVQEGAMVLARGRHAGSSEVELLRTLLEACGQCEEVPEAQVDVHTGLSGSGVAFVSVTCPPHPAPRPAISQVPVAAPTLRCDGVVPAAHEPGSPKSLPSWPQLWALPCGWCPGPAPEGPSLFPRGLRPGER